MTTRFRFPTITNAYTPTGNEIVGENAFNTDTGVHVRWNGSAWVALGTSGSGDVVGPASSTDNAVPQFDGTTGKLLKNGPSIGTAANNLVQLNGSARLPAVDGSQLTGLPSGGGVTVQDEGTPLATTATTLNFAGAGVVASGTGATKTITVAGAGGVTYASSADITFAHNTVTVVTSGGTGTNTVMASAAADAKIVIQNNSGAGITVSRVVPDTFDGQTSFTVEVGASRGFVIDAASTDWKEIQTPAGSGGVTDHGALTGLNDDDHTQYARFTSAAADPTVNDDSGNGYRIGTRWQNTATKRIFESTDVTVGAAVWVPLTPANVTHASGTPTLPVKGAATLSGTVAAANFPTVPAFDTVLAVRNTTGAAITLTAAGGATISKLDGTSAGTIDVPANSSIGFTTTAGTNAWAEY